MKKLALFTLVSILLSLNALSQDFGISASFFLPKNGYFSAPISPLSIRGVSLASAGIFSIDIGGSLYRMSGMSITTNEPIDTRKPMVGPFFNVMVPLEAVISLGSKNTVFLIKGGGFAFYNFGTKLNYGNIDRAMLNYLDLEIANSDFTFTNNIGFGYEFGLELIQYLNRQFGITLGANYYVGGAKLNLQGTVKGVDANSLVSSTSVDLSDAKLDYTGLEISIGLIFSSGRRR
ncbi:MAG: hypothetical protein L3J29_11580 [Cyclobacteriaceae bacterium]|nr:hypothetical protein [Cyclobacteriaceae bacterium]